MELQPYKSWGRSINPDTKSKLTSFLLPFFAYATVCFLLQKTLVIVSTSSFIKTFCYVIGWITFQLVLANLPERIGKKLPAYEGGIKRGQMTPAGYILEYNINGLQSWIITHALFIFAIVSRLIDPAFIAKNWFQIFLSANIIGFFLSVFAYIKAHKFPSHEHDCKFTKHPFYDFVMGAEFNPRFFGVDMKLFFNGRPGIIGWTLINASFAAYQFQRIGYISNSMILVNILQAIYVLDFFWNEDWYTSFS